MRSIVRSTIQWIYIKKKGYIALAKNKTLRKEEKGIIRELYIK